MSPEQLGEMTPLKWIAPVVILLAMMAFGLMMHFATAPSPGDIEQLRMQQLQMEMAMQQAEMVQEMQYEMMRGIDYAEAMQAASPYGGY